MDDATSREAVKESRRVLRSVQTHLSQAHLNLGVQQETMGLVDVIYHPTNNLPHLNYISPRKNTAWIPGPEIEKGMGYLRDLGRVPRVTYIEGLFPPQFAKTMRELNLVVEREIPLMAFRADDHTTTRPTLLTEMNYEEAKDQDGVAMWWYVWRNAYYDVITGGTEPVYIGQDMREITLGRQVDLILHRYGFPIGVVRLTLHDQTAHINAIAIMKEERSSDVVRVLHHIALKSALDRGCTLIFTSGDTEQNRGVCRDIGFVDFGSLVWYAEKKVTEEDARVAEPVFVLR
ncbi:MAG: hypothetical protein OHK0046_13540 [Anaerolineae bacterium]